ncbi:MAG: magnesium ion transporter [Chaenotheca gracillima]|nr:MAG: magnesium ion transporter [Chaenotheca gracillima]
MPYLLFSPATAVTSNGLGINDTQRMGVYVACAAVASVNIYILLNTYRWDWLILLIVSISILLVFFWTGVYSAFSASASFYKAAPQVLGQPTFWACVVLTIIICLLPRFTIKVFQKIYMPRDIDIIREQIRLGKFDYLDDEVGADGKSPMEGSSTTSSDIIKPIPNSTRNPHSNTNNNNNALLAEDERPIYPPSVAPTATTHNPRSQNGSDGTDYTGHRQSLETPMRRSSFDRPMRPSFDRMRSSMDKTRPSFEASRDFTSAALLTRLESSHSYGQAGRSRDITADLR